MALDVTALDNYTKENKDVLLTVSVMGSKTASLLTWQPGIKSSENINILDTDVIFQAGGSCDNTPSGTTTIIDRKITVGNIRVQENLCPSELEAKYTQLMLQAGSQPEAVPFEKQYTDLKVSKTKAAVEVALWKGDTLSANANLNKFDGLLKIIDAEGSVINGNPTGITAATGIIATNVRTIFKTQNSKIPVELRSADDLISACGWDTFTTLLDKLTDDNLFNYTADAAAAAGELIYPGTRMKIVALDGLNGTNRIITARKSNLYGGTDMMNEEEQFEMKYLTEAEVVRYKNEFKLGTQIAFPSEIVSFKLVP